MKDNLKRILCSHNLKIAIELFDIEFCFFEIWIKPWIQDVVIMGIERQNFMFHVFYLSHEIEYNKGIWRIEFCGIKNFKWRDDD